MDEKELNRKISDASIVLDIREKDIFALLDNISKNKSIDSKLLLRKFGFPEIHFKRILEFFREILMPPTSRVELKDNENQIHQFVTESLTKIKNIDKKSIREVLENIQKIRPIPDRQYDQFTATAITTSRRASEMAKNGDLYKRSVVFLGDDDLTSIAVGITKQAKRITVFEIDTRITSLIEKISSEYNLGIEVIKRDLRSAFPKDYLSQFDSVFTDPPYTPSGISLFLNRGIELLRKRYTSRLYLCYGNSDRARERELEIQKIITDKELLIHSKYFQFNKYTGAESIGSSSSLYLLDWTPKTKLTEIYGKFYTNE